MDITAAQRPLPPCFTITCVANGWIAAPAAGNFAIYDLKDAHVFLDEQGVKMHITAARERWLHDCAQFDAPKPTPYAYQDACTTKWDKTS